MADKSVDKTLKVAATFGAESPTTARPLDFDDDVQDGSAAPPENLISPPPPAKSPKPRVSFQEEEAPPPKPPRPMSPQAQAENTLLEAFPSVDAKVVKAVLVASGGKVEPAFNALLSMSDPDFRAEETPPPQPPRPRQPQSQLEADEQYARQLAQHYQSGTTGYGSRERGEPPLPKRRKDTNLKPNELYDDREHSFFDDIADDLPVIKENMRKGFLETQNTVNSWITNFRKKLDGDDEESDVVQPGTNQRQNFGPSQSEQLYSIRKSSEARRSGDRERYDADNRVLGDDFEALELRDEEGPTHHSRAQRPLANPDLFKPTPVAPPQGGPVDEVEARDRQAASTQGNKTKKWQPLTSVAPHPEPDDHDPFSLGDSDEDEAKAKDIKSEDTERLKKLASESGVEKKGETGKELKPAERSGSLGTKDQTAEELLKTAK